MTSIASKSFALAFLCSALAVFSAFQSQAGEKSVRFRAGTVISAEISPVKPEILNESAFEPYKDMKSVYWAEVVVHLDKDRSLSAADYSLVCNGVECKCLAVAEDNKAYNVGETLISKTSPLLPYRLLFPVKSPSYDKPQSYELRFKLLASPMPDVPLKFRNTEGSRFTEVSKLPAEGSLGMSSTELRILNRKPAN